MSRNIAGITYTECKSYNHAIKITIALLEYLLEHEIALDEVANMEYALECDKNMLNNLEAKIAQMV